VRFSEKKSAKHVSDRPVLDLPTPEGWKAELTWAAGYIPRWFTCPQAVTHRSIKHLEKGGGPKTWTL